MIGTSHAGLRSHLANAATTEIDAALSSGGTSAGGVAVNKPTSEPTAVAAVVLVAVPKIAAAWKPLLSPHGYTVTIHGVFCHLSPQVRFTGSGGSRKQCELADLLIVIDDATSGAATDRRASLVQAKLASASGRISIGTSTDADQLDLLRHWHSFTFVSGAYNSSGRDFTAAGQPGTWSDSGTYGGIELSAPDWTQTPPGASPMSLAGKPSLGEFIAGMAFGNAGDGRATAVVGPPASTTGPLGSDDWSATVAELLDTTFRQTFTLVAAVNAATPPRGVTALALLGQPPGPGVPRVEIGPDDGISTVYVRIGRAIASGG